MGLKQLALVPLVVPGIVMGRVQTDPSQISLSNLSHGDQTQFLNGQIVSFSASATVPYGNDGPPSCGIFTSDGGGGYIGGPAANTTYAFFDYYSYTTTYSVSMIYAVPNSPGSTFFFGCENYGDYDLLEYRIAPVFLDASITEPPADETVCAGETVEYQGSAILSGVAGTPGTSFDWSFPGGTPSSALGAGPHQVAYNQPGSFNTTLDIAVSTFEASASTTRQITVLEVAAPTASIVQEPPGQIIAGRTFTFRAMGSDDANCGGNDLTYLWELQTPDGGRLSSARALVTAQGDTFTYTFPSGGAYVLTLVASSPTTGLVSRTSSSLAVNDPVGPTAQITNPSTDASILEREQLVFECVGEDTDTMDPVSYAWSFSGGDPASADTAGPHTVSFATPGEYQVSCTVTDSDGLQTSAFRTVTVNARQADLAIQATQVPGPSFVGDVVSYEFQITNGGPGGAQGVSVTIELPDGLGIQDLHSDQLACDLDSLTCTTGSLALGSSATVAAEAEVLAEADNNLVVVGRVSGNEEDPDLDNNSTEAATTVGTNLAKTLFGLDPNQLHLAETIDATCFAPKTPALRAACAELVGLTPDDQRDAIYAMTPDQIGALFGTAASIPRVQVENIGQRLLALRNGAKGLSVGGLAMNVDGKNVPLRLVTDELLREASGGGASADSIGDFGRLGFFVNGSLELGDKNDSIYEAGLDFRTKGITLGTDYRFTDKFIAGAALGYASTNTDYSGDRGDFDLKALWLSTYGSVYLPRDFYVDWIAGYGRGTYDITRNVRYGGVVDTSILGDTNSDQFEASLSLGASWNFGAVQLVPFGRAEYLRTKIDGFTEKGGTALTRYIFDDQKFDSLTLALGTAVSRPWSMSWGVLTPSVSLEWEHQFKDDRRRIDYWIAEDPVNTTILETNDPDRDYANLGLGVAGTFANGRSAFLRYETTLGHRYLDRQVFELGIRAEF